LHFNTFLNLEGRKENSSTIGVGMPVFNDIEFIEQSIKSILKQSFIDFQLVISDDGSTDGSDEICKKYAALDDRIIYIRQTNNLGISKNMQFLLEKSNNTYFMWAADDDLWHPDFLRNLVKLLEQNEDSIVAFCKYDLIDERNNSLKSISKPKYSHKSPVKRLRNFIIDADDGFGYGLFKRAHILEVKFPTWWWINKNTPYNNIYPTLCYYLTKGNYVEHSNKTLFYKRIKTGDNIHHKIIGNGNAFKETFAYILRKFNLITYSTREIRKNGSKLLAIRIYPVLFYSWFIHPSFLQIKLALTSFYKNRLKRN